MMDCGHKKFYEEQSVEYVRRKLLAHRASFDAILTAQDYLGQVGMKLSDNSLMISRWTLVELMAEEQKRQLPVPGGMECFVLNPDVNQSVCGALSSSATIEAAGENQPFEQYRHGLLHGECKARAEQCKEFLIAQTSFSPSQGLRYLSREDLPPEAQEPLPLGVYLEYIHSGRYLILTGNMGTSKPHPALGQGTQADSERFFIIFIMIIRMLDQVSESRSEKPMANREQCLENNDPTIGDEFGDIACNKEGSALLFNHRSLMPAPRSMIIINTLSYDRWQEVFRDSALPAAMIDRLIGLAFIINMTNQRSSIKETCK